MRNKHLIFGLLVLMLVPISFFGQLADWDKLKVLESNRSEVEKILGNPVTHFDTFGIYRTEIGKFAVWYSKGGCHKNIEGLQYNIPAQKLTRLIFYPQNKPLIKSYVSDIDNYERTVHPTMDYRFFYTSLDESIIYETIQRKSSSEFIYSIELQRSKEKRKLLCNYDAIKN